MLRVMVIMIISLCLITLRVIPAQADQLLTRVSDWLIMRTELNQGKACYLASMPFRTKAYYGLKDREPRFVIAYLGPDEYTIKVDVDYNINKVRPVVISIDTISRVLESVPDSEQAHTFSSVQDIAMINDLIMAEGYFTVRSYDQNDNQALDYYSLKGFGKAIRLISGICK